MRNIVLLSGGLDSAVLLASLTEPAIAVTFDYRQRHSAELGAAAAVAKRYGAHHLVIPIDPVVFGVTPLTGGEPVPGYASTDSLPEGLPRTYVPGRNTIFLAHAVAVASTTGARTIMIGVTSEDIAFPDCTYQYIEAYNRMLWYAVPGPLVVDAPFQRWTKSEVVELGVELGVDFSLTSSCYNATVVGDACGTCEACLRRDRALRSSVDV